MVRGAGWAVAGPALVAVAVLLGGCQSATGTAEDPGATGDGSAPTAAAGDASTATGSAAPSAVASQDDGRETTRDSDLTARVVQYRRDAELGVVQVKVTNGGDEAVRVARVALESSTFLETAYDIKDSRIGPGLSVDLTVPLVDPACPAEGSGDGVGDGAGDGVGDGGHRVGDGGHRVGLQIDGNGVWLPLEGTVLQQVRDARCAEIAVAELVQLGFEGRWEDAGEVDGEPALSGRLVVSPEPGAGPFVVSLSGATTLFTVAEPATVELAGQGPAAGPVLLDVVLTVTRCDAHAVAEDKKGYLFPVRVQEPGADEAVVEVAVPLTRRAPLRELISRSCG